MKYISRSFNFVKDNPVLLITFIFLSLGTVPMEMLNNLGVIGNLKAMIIDIFLFIGSFYFLAGTHSCIWKSFSGDKETLKLILPESNRYFRSMLFVTVVIGLIGISIMMLAVLIHSKVFYPATDSISYSKQFDANLVRTVPVYFLAILFAYAIPIIFVSSYRGTTLFKTAINFIVKNLSLSLPIISLISLSFVIKILMTQYAVRFDYSSIFYWRALITEQIVVNIIGILTFLTAAQIFKEHFKEEEIQKNI